MVISIIVTSIATVLLSLIACNDEFEEAKTANQNRKTGYVWQVPEGFPIPRVPKDNPMTYEKVELGRQLFYDTRLSGDGTVSCATCHQPERAFTDGRSRAVGIAGSIHPRSAMSLTNVAYNATLGWDDPNQTRLEDQILVPLYNTQPPEMGVAYREKDVLDRFKKDRRVRRLFQKAFAGEQNPITMRNIIYALASFERTLISGNSAYDRWAYVGKTDALDKDQRAGARLFFSQRLSCFRCHAGFNFSGPVTYEGSDTPAARFHNTALYDEDGQGAYPDPNTGLHRHSGLIGDMGKFRAPTLRNIALTAPYMHDGSIPTLEAVLDHYAAGGRSRLNIDRKGEADAGSVIDPLMTGFDLTPDEKRQLIAFLHALTDESFVEQAQEQMVR
jgi:cytochrome c peroxidase